MQLENGLHTQVTGTCLRHRAHLLAEGINFSHRPKVLASHVDRGPALSCGQGVLASHRDQGSSLTHALTVLVSHVGWGLGPTCELGVLVSPQTWDKLLSLRFKARHSAGSGHSVFHNHH